MSSGGATWIGFMALAVAAMVVSVLPRVSPIIRALPATVVIGGSLILVAFDLRPTPPSPAMGTLVSLVISTLGVVAGSAVTSAVLQLAMRSATPPGTHGGILVTTSSPGLDVVDAPVPNGSSGATREVLRGGAAIGHLERFAVISAAAIGHLELVALAIAIKGLGRFSELDNAEARERFIIGTLSSMLWAGAAACVVLLP